MNAVASLTYQTNWYCKVDEFRLLRKHLTPEQARLLSFHQKEMRALIDLATQAIRSEATAV